MSRMEQYEESLYFINEDYLKNENNNSIISNSYITKTKKIKTKGQKETKINRIYNENNKHTYFEENNYCDNNKNWKKIQDLIKANHNDKNENYLDEAFENNEFNQNFYNRKIYLSSIKDEFEDEELEENVFNQNENNINNLNKLKNQLNNSNNELHNNYNSIDKNYNSNISSKNFVINQNYFTKNKNNNLNENFNNNYGEDQNDLEKNYDSPQIMSQNLKKTGKWSESEDLMLSELVSRFGGKNWKKISEFIPGRTSIQCLHRWTKILQPGLVKGPWTIEEDRKLLEWIRKEGPTKWTQCADFIKGRNGKQCRERWFHTLNPKIIKGNWSIDEDFKIFCLYEFLGGKWAKIANFISGRTENSIKNRFYSTLRRKAAEKLKIEISNACDKNKLKGEKSNSKTSMSKNSNSNSNYSNSENSHLSLEDETIFNNVNNKKGINIQNCVTSLSLEELLKYLEAAKFEVTIKLMKTKNLTPDQVKEYQNNIISCVNNSKSQKSFLENNIFFSEQNINNNLNQNNSFNLHKNSIGNHNPINPCINLNLNINSNSNNNYILHNNNLSNNLNLKDSIYPKQYEESNFNNVGFNDVFDKKECNLLSNNNPISDFRNMDIFSLENNILDMCDDPSFLYTDSNFNFLDNQVDNIIDNMFLKNNILITNKDNEDCNLCFSNNNLHNTNYNVNNKNIHDENKIKIENEDILKLENNASNENHSNLNSQKVNQEKLPIIKEEKLESNNQINNTIPNENSNLNNLINVNNSPSSSTGDKKTMLNSLISQLEDLERLVKSTKNELMKYNTNEKDSCNDILNKANLRNLNSKIENLLK